MFIFGLTIKLSIDEKFFGFGFVLVVLGIELRASSLVMQAFWHLSKLC
jgi:hypothetical protein